VDPPVSAPAEAQRVGVRRTRLDADRRGRVARRPREAAAPCRVPRWRPAVAGRVATGAGQLRLEQLQDAGLRTRVLMEHVTDSSVRDLVKAVVDAAKVARHY
jgi:hypothetical protein